MNKMENFKAGFIRENPVFGLYLGLCSALAISTTLDNAIGMGVSVIVVLVLSNVIISAIRKITPNEIRIPVYIVVIATLVTCVEMILHAYMLSLYSSLGEFISLIVVNCIILGRAEAFASKNNVVDSAIDGIGMGLGYTFSLILISATRQLLSTMSLSFSNPLTNEIIFNFELTSLEPFKIDLFGSNVGAFLTFACFSALFAVLKKRADDKASKGAK